MPRLEVKPTRIELIQIKKRIKLATRGLHLLKMKRSSLVMEFFAISKQVSGMRENLRSDVGNALSTLKSAEIISGTMELERIAYMSADSTVEVGLKNVMGVKIPELNSEYSPTILSNLYRSTSVPAPINDAIGMFEIVYRQILEIAEKENSMRKLLIEIDKTKRRSNAIENILIPELSSVARYIRGRLDEIERDTFTNLKMIKKKLMKNGEAI
ncbi:MAG: V-type ATP synthase subunit D [Thermoplasmatales archaeon]|nr:V-type ATP synthase subunit D [Thermoplasmatales archaeon]